MKKSTLFLYILTAFFFVLILVLAYLNYFSSSKTPATSNTTTNPSLLPTESLDSTSPLSNLKTYIGKDFTYPNNIYSGYSFEYPDTCTQEKEILTCTLKNSLATIQINAGGHGGGEGNFQVLVDNQTKIFNDIEGKLTAIEDLDNKTVFGTYWINKTPKLTQEPIFGFEFSQISSTDFDEFKNLFESLLSSLKFTESNGIAGWKKVSFQQYITSDDCILANIGSPRIITTTLDKFVSDYSKSTWSTETYSLYPTQFKSKKYQTITLPAVDMEEISNTFLLSNKSVYLITAMVNKPIGPPVCKSNYDSEISVLINSLSF